MIEQKLLWSPTKEFIASSNLKKYESWLGSEYGLKFSDYDEMWQWSIDHIADFWESIWKYFEIVNHAPYDRVISGMEMPGVKWFEGAKISYAEHLFRHKSPNRPALLFFNELCCKQVSWDELETMTLAVQSFLIDKGVKVGDRVVGYLPNIPEAIAIFIAVNSLGAVWSCCSPDFGVNTVVDRFEQIQPKVLFCTNGYQYGGNVFSRVEENQFLFTSIPSLEHVVELEYVDGIHSNNEQIDSWNKVINSDVVKRDLKFTPIEFNEPIWVLYSSGTTGKPKAITHSAGGVLLEHLKYMSFHNDVKPAEHFFWFSTTGWMMWNILQASMLVGAVPVLYDGSPGYPGIDMLWKGIGDIPIHHFGTSAPFINASMKAGMEMSGFDFSKLRSIGSTGSPLAPEGFDWVYNSVSKEVWLCSLSGGTDVCTAFVGGNPYLPVYKSAIQCRALGCALMAYDDDGNPIYGSLGEMVIEKPMPSMPIYFWNDENNERYISSYFDSYAGKWRHGDWIVLYENGSLIIQGRSDATLNRNGIRIGTAEIYNVLDDISEIKDALVLNLEKSLGEDIMPLFVSLIPGTVLEEKLIEKIRKTLRSRCSPRHVPDVIIEVGDIPYTLSGKKMEVPVKKLLMNQKSKTPINKDAIRNPESMIAFEEMAVEFRKKYLIVD